MPANKEIDDPLIKRLVHLRRQVLHRFPELSGEESETANQIAAFLKSCEPDELRTGIGGHGIIAVFNGQTKGDTVMLRCELDALAIHETSDIEHKSRNSGVAHKCGHDGHMAILCGVAAVLKQNRPETGRVILLFQPAEENGAGAKEVISDAHFKKFEPDWIFALHNLPGFPLNAIIVKDGLFNPAVNSLIVKFIGHTAHAAEPEKGENPALAMAELVTKMVGKSDTKDPDDFTIVTPVYQSMGEKAYGVSAGEGEVHFTLRCDNSDKMKNLERQAEDLAVRIAENHGLKTEIEWTEEFYSGFNDSEATERIREAAKATGSKIIEQEHPFKWGEDFGLYTHHYRGAMFCVGAGEEHPALHHPDYDFPDEIIETATQVFLKIIMKITNV